MNKHEGNQSASWFESLHDKQYMMLKVEMLMIIVNAF